MIANYNLVRECVVSILGEIYTNEWHYGNVTLRIIKDCDDYYSYIRITGKPIHKSNGKEDIVAYRSELKDLTIEELKNIIKIKIMEESIKPKENGYY